MSNVKAILAALVLLAAAGTLHAVDGESVGDQPPERSRLTIKHGTLNSLDRITQLPSKGFVVQLGVFSDETRVRRYVSEKRLRDLHLFSAPYVKDGKNYQILFYGPFRHEDNAREIREVFRKRLGVDAFVRSVDSLHPAGD